MMNPRPVGNFYAPISSGSMAHVGPQPQGNVQYHVIAPVSGGGIRSGISVTTRSPLPQPVTGPQGYMPPSLNTITHPMPVGPRGAPGGGVPNWFNNHNI